MVEQASYDEDDWYWRVVEETIQTVFRRDAGVAADLRAAVMARPWMERQAFYNMEPFDLAADLLEVAPSKNQRAQYEQILRTSLEGE